MSKILAVIVFLFLCFQNVSADIGPECDDANDWIGLSDIVVLGKVAKIVFHARKDPKKEKHWTQFDNMTHTKILAEKYIKGSGPSEITILTHCLENGICVEDEPRFNVGQKGYLFLKEETRVGTGLYWSVCGLGAVPENAKDGLVKETLENYLQHGTIQK
ncbi:hypothetical protein ACFL1E_03735 [Candidatus Omnitrophota bacterium]